MRSLCQDYDEAVTAMGTQAADALRTRLADLRAVTVLADLPARRPGIVAADIPQLRFELIDGWYLLLGVGHERVPRTESGDLDLSRVRRAIVQEISR